jgi:hypothetical protein
MHGGIALVTLCLLGQGCLSFAFHGPATSRYSSTRRGVSLGTGFASGGVMGLGPGSWPTGRP